MSVLSMKQRAGLGNTTSLHGRHSAGIASSLSVGERFGPQRTQLDNDGESQHSVCHHHASYDTSSSRRCFLVCLHLGRTAPMLWPAVSPAVGLVCLRFRTFAISMAVTPLPMFCTFAFGGFAALSPFPMENRGPARFALLSQDAVAGRILHIGCYTEKAANSLPPAWSGQYRLCYIR